MPTGRRFTALERLKVKAEVTALHIQRYDQYEIAEILRLSQGQFSTYLKQIRDEYARRMIANRDEHVSKQLLELDKIRNAAGDAWTRSVAGGNVGNVDYLLVVLRCMEREAKLFGLDAPLTMKIDFTNLTDDELELIRSGYALPTRVK
jgi:hypothetical protein